MSEEARNKAKRWGLKSGKGRQLLSRLLGRLDDEPTDSPDGKQ
ncbi:hypothetical protein [Salinarchaeum laminariae]|nr:hypothetical protein [Salinarchaeum laminariae]